MKPIDWSTEWWRSLIYVFGVWGITLVLLFLLGRLLTRRTQWGRQFWQISGAYFVPRYKSWLAWRPTLTVALLLFLTILGVRISVVLSNANNALFTALQNKDAQTFWKYVVILALLFGFNIVQQLANFYIASAQIIHWRQWLNGRVLADWLGGAAYHRGRFVREPIDNPDQRIQADITTFASTSQTLALGLVGSMVSLVSFSIILWGLAGPLPIFGVTIPKGLIFVVIIFVIPATLVAFRVGRPLIRLSFLSEMLGASYRYALVRVRDNSETVAFFRGEGVENANLLTRFGAVIANQWALVFRNLKFLGWNFVVDQSAVLLPLIIQAPRYFAGAIQLGDVTQTSTAFGSVLDSLSFFRNAYDNFASYRAVLIRLTGLLDSNDESRALPSAALQDRPAGLELRDFDVRMPDGRPILTDLDLDLPPGATLLVKGPSGSGKTTLLRSLAGLWPHSSGLVSRPVHGGVLFCPQQPYLPLGSLRTALAYPAPVGSLADDPARALLRDVQLGHLADRLDEEADWSKVLSPGEQQRLTFGRLLWMRPAVAFLDEATAALDEGMEHAMYALVQERLPQTILVSVGHRSSLEPVHRGELRLLGEGRWETRALVQS